MNTFTMATVNIGSGGPAPAYIGLIPHNISLLMREQVLGKSMTRNLESKAARLYNREFMALVQPTWVHDRQVRHTPSSSLNNAWLYQFFTIVKHFVHLVKASTPGALTSDLYSS